MMNNMQISNLVKFFPQDEKDGVQELGEFAKIIPPTKLSYDQLIRIVRVIDRLTA
jgi:hypothetical protein